jgi:hypothetical protein
VPVGIIEKGCDLFLLPRVERARDNRSAGGLDLPDQRLELGAVATVNPSAANFFAISAPI